MRLSWWAWVVIAGLLTFLWWLRGHRAEWRGNQSTFRFYPPFDSEEKERYLTWLLAQGGSHAEAEQSANALFEKLEKGPPWD